MSNENWYNINFSVDLVEATINQLAFLKQVDRIGHLYKGYYFEQALLRYELIWLPLKAENNNVNLVPPIDVQWIWHLHMLSSAMCLYTVFLLLTWAAICACCCAIMAWCQAG